jgi:hypothetical protein
VVAGLVCFNDPPRYTGGSVATGRVSHARQVGGEKPEEQATHRSSRMAGVWA